MSSAFPPAVFVDAMLYALDEIVMIPPPENLYKKVQGLAEILNRGELGEALGFTVRSTFTQSLVVGWLSHDRADIIKRWVERHKHLYVGFAVYRHIL